MNEIDRKLKEYTDNFPPFNPWFLNEDRVWELACEQGKATSVGIYSNENISAAEITFYPDTIQKIQAHPEIAVVQVLEGELVVTVVEDSLEHEIVLKQYGVLIIQPMIRHWYRNVVKTVIFSTTMPLTVNFPKPQ